VGSLAGSNDSGTGSVAVGVAAGIMASGINSIAVGFEAGADHSGTGSIAIGRRAGDDYSGIYSISIGSFAGLGPSGSHDNTIILNASGTGLSSSHTGGFFVNPIADATGSTGGHLLMYQDNEIVASTMTSLPSKTFVIDHPLDNDKYLVHACLEGPEVGVYYRGNAFIQSDKRSCTIKLPHYVDAIATDFTTHITPIGCEYRSIIPSVSKVKNSEFTIFGDPGEYSWVVYGTRYPCEPEIPKDSVVVQGEGPYRWLKPII
jgi:hypothetical protein